MNSKKVIHTLIVEDQPTSAEAYGNIISSSITDFSVKVEFAYNCDDAIDALKASEKHLVLLDIQIPASGDGKFISREDIGLWLRKKHPKTKILILTFITDAERIHSIIKEINPQGLIIKSDMSSIDLITAVKALLNDKTYYSKTTKTLNNNSVNGHAINDIARKILYHLSMGETNKAIAKKVHLSLRAIEDRKLRLKHILGVKNNVETNLVKEAKRRHII